MGHTCYPSLYHRGEHDLDTLLDTLPRKPTVDDLGEFLSILPIGTGAETRMDETQERPPVERTNSAKNIGRWMEFVSQVLESYDSDAVSHHVEKDM